MESKQPLNHSQHVVETSVGFWSITGAVITTPVIVTWMFNKVSTGSGVGGHAYFLAIIVSLLLLLAFQIYWASAAAKPSHELSDSANDKFDANANTPISAAEQADNTAAEQKGDNPNETHLNPPVNTQTEQPASRRTDSQTSDSTSSLH